MLVKPRIRPFNGGFVCYNLETWKISYSDGYARTMEGAYLRWYMKFFFVNDHLNVKGEFIGTGLSWVSRNAADLSFQAQ